METFVLRLRLIGLALRRLLTALGVAATERKEVGESSAIDALELWTDAPLVWLVPCPGAVYRGVDLGPVCRWLPSGVRRYMYETQHGAKSTVIAWPDDDLIVPRESKIRDKQVA